MRTRTARRKSEIAKPKPEPDPDATRYIRVDVTTVLHRKIRMLAAEQDVTISGLIRQMLEDRLQT